MYICVYRWIGIMLMFMDSVGKGYLNSGISSLWSALLCKSQRFFFLLLTSGHQAVASP